MKDFLNTLFEPKDLMCFTSDTFGIAVKAEPGPADIFLSINALTGWRSDANVATHRNFLLEFDQGTFEAQKAIVQASGVPISAAVSSGNKSIHFYVCLQEPVTAVEYAHLARRLFLALPTADKSCKNPSRLARLPGRIRPDTGKLQECLYTAARTSRATLEAMLPPLAPKIVSATIAGNSVLQRQTMLLAQRQPETAIRQLGLAGRNGLFHWLGQRLSEANFDSEFCEKYVRDVYEALENKSNFTWKEARNAARL